MAASDGSSGDATAEIHAVGQFEASFIAPQAAALPPACRDATHFVISVEVGAFNLSHAGAESTHEGIDFAAVSAKSQHERTSESHDARGRPRCLPGIGADRPRATDELLCSSAG